MLRQIVLGLGGNLGDVQNSIREANAIIEQQLSVEVLSSGFYETQPWGNIQQPNFINSVSVFHSNNALSKIFGLIQSIEKQFGREREKEQKWGARNLDIDVLFFGNTVINTKKIEIPHPHIINRNFVLVPLAEIMADFVHPVFNTSISQLIKKSPDKLKVTLL